jgi:hypothetical protein
MHPVYGVHVVFILLLWAAFFWAAFAFPPGPSAIRSARLFWGLVAAGLVPAAAGFVLLRRGGLAAEPGAMFRRTVWGDALTALALAVLLAVFWLTRDAMLFMTACLGGLVVLQTHVPFVDDEALDPPELKAILDEAGLRK